MMKYREKTCCFTGHREIPLMKYVLVKKRLRETLEDLIERGYCFFGTGGALGFDTLAAQTVLELREKHPEIKLILVLPCLSQADKWNDTEKKVYEKIMKCSDKVVYTSNEYSQGCMHKRNRHLVDYSSYVYVTKQKKKAVLHIPSIMLNRKD